MSEVRPWQGSSISVGQFKVNRLLRLIDCSVNYGKSWIDFHGETAEERRKLTVWSDIDNAFSKPVIPSDQSSEYVPTQVIAEFFKSHCYDGIVYKRSLSSTGFNVVLFDLGVADLINCFLYEVQEIDFKFKETANPYFMKTHYNSAD